MSPVSPRKRGTQATSDIADIVGTGDRIEARLGHAAAVEWRVLLNQFALGEGFAFLVLAVPGPAAAQFCHAELSGFLHRSGKTILGVDCGTEARLLELPDTLLSVAAGGAVGAIWIDVTSTGAVPDGRAWRSALAGLNQQRNPLRRRFRVPVILVCPPDLEPTIKEIAPDLWSIRSLAIRIAPKPHRPPRPAAADPDFALRAAARIRGRPNQTRALAEVLLRAGEGFMAQSRLREAETVWREAADLWDKLADRGQSDVVRARLNELAAGRTRV